MENLMLLYLKTLPIEALIENFMELFKDKLYAGFYMGVDCLPEMRLRMQDKQQRAPPAATEPRWAPCF